MARRQGPARPSLPRVRLPLPRGPRRDHDRGPQDSGDRRPERRRSQLGLRRRSRAPRGPSCGRPPQDRDTHRRGDRRQRAGGPRPLPRDALRDERDERYGRGLGPRLAPQALERTPDARAAPPGPARRAPVRNRPLARPAAPLRGRVGDQRPRGSRREQRGRPRPRAHGLVPRRNRRLARRTPPLRLEREGVRLRAQRRIRRSSPCRGRARFPGRRPTSTTSGA